MAADPYLIAGTDVLANKLGLKEQAALAKAEADLSFNRIRELKTAPVAGRFDLKHLKAIHRYIFQDVYAWAGQLRTIRMGKAEAALGGRSIRYPDPQARFPPDNLVARAEYAFDALAREQFLKGLSRAPFIEQFARHTTEIWEVHPFRDGNTRATLVFIQQVAREAGYRIQTRMAESTHAVREALVRAAGLSDYARLQPMVAQSLASERDLASELKAIKAADPARYARLSALAREADRAARVRFADPDERQHYVAEKLGHALDAGQAAKETPSREIDRPHERSGDEYEL